MCWMAVQMPLQRWLAAASDTRVQKMDVSQAKKLVASKAGARVVFQLGSAAA